MTRFNESCVAWVSTRACPTSVVHNWKIMCLFFAAVTATVGIVSIIMIIRRLYLLKAQNMMFKIMAPTFVVWTLLQFLYTILHGMSPSRNFDVSFEILTLSNLQSSMVLGLPLPFIILVWSKTYASKKSFKEDSHSLWYWCVSCVYFVMTGIVSVLVGVNFAYYKVCMRLLLVMWIIFLGSCQIGITYYGIQNLRLLSSNDQQYTKDNTESQKGRSRIKRILIACNPIFTMTLAVFLYYTIDLVDIERNNIISLVIWTLFKVFTVIFVVFWTWYFWNNTTELYAKQQKQQSQSLPSCTTTKSDDVS